MKQATTSENTAAKSGSPEALTKGGAGCLSLISLPFLALGVGMLIFAFTLHQKGHKNAPGAAAFGAIALGIGVVILLLIRWLFSHGQRIRQRTADHPNEPWRWKSEWTDGRITDSNKSAAIFLWCFAIFWNAFSIPVAIFLVLPEIAKGRYGAAFVLLFPLVGLGLLYGAIHTTLRFLKFGRSTLELETLPGAIGGWLAGSIETSVPVTPGAAIRLTLRCVNRITTGSGKNRRTTERQLWQDEQLLTGRLPSTKAGGSSIPVAFRIPSDCEPSHDGNNNDILWRLRAHADLSGADYQSDFVVPVFSIPQADGFFPKSEPIASNIRSAEFEKAQLNPDLDVVTDAAGRMRFHFPASKRRATAMTVTAFLLVFSTIAFVIVAVGGPTFFAILFGLVSAILLWAAMVLWFRDVELRVDPHGVQRVRRMLGMTGTYTIPRSDAKIVRYKETSQVNENVYYTVQVETTDEKTVPLISGLPINHARSLAERIATTIGVESAAEKRQPKR